MQRVWLHSGISSIIAGYLITYAFAPYSLWPLAIISPLLLLYCWHRFPSHLLWVTIAYGMGYFTAGAWIFVSLYEHADVSFTLSILATLLFVCSLGMSFLFVYLAYHKLPGPSWVKACIYFPVSWALMEYSRTLSSFAYPWLLLPYSQTSGPLILLSPWIGVYGMTIVLTLLAASIYMLIMSKNWRFILPIIGVSAMLSYASSQPITPGPHRTIHTLVIQPVVPETDKWHEASLTKVIDHYDRLLMQNLANDSLVILPESAIPYVPQAAESSFTDLVQQLDKHHAGAIIGSFDRTGPTIYNSAVGLGQAHGTVYKHRLVAFGETTPDIPLLNTIIQRMHFPMSRLQPAPTPPHQMDFAGKKVATFICYEIAFPDEVIARAQDADIIVVISDNIWFGTSHASYQHRQIAQFYAYMLKKPTIFVNNSGLSAIIDTQGHIVRTLDNQRAGMIDYKLEF